MKHTSKMFRALFSTGGIQFILGFAVGAFTSQAFAQGNTWETKAPRPTAISSSSAGVIDGILYVVGGNLGGFGFDVVEAYDPVSDTWTTKAPIPTARSGAASGVIDGKLYVAGGRRVDNNPINTLALEIYDPAADSWSAGAPMLSPARAGMAAGVIDGILYVVGGDHVGSFDPTLDAYDPVLDSWTRMTPMQFGRRILAAGVIAGKLYAVGGLAACCVSQATLQIYDPQTDSWTLGAPLPAGRVGPAVGVIGGKLYAVGGNGTSSLDNDTFEYDPMSDIWDITRAPMPTPRTNASAGVIDGKLYVVGGIDAASAVAVLEVYTPPQSVAANAVCPAANPFESCPTSVDIQIDMTSTFELLGSFTATLSWDPTIVDYTGNSELSAGFTEVINEDDVAAGLLTFSGVNAQGASGVIDLLTVDFDVIGNEDEVNTFDLDFSAMAAANSFNDLLPILTANDCSSTIDDGGVLGDVNNDGLVNSTDALIVLSDDISLPIPAAFEDRTDRGFGDIDEDVLTNSTDALIILSYDVGLDVSQFPIDQLFCGQIDL